MSQKPRTLLYRPCSSPFCHLPILTFTSFVSFSCPIPSQSSLQEPRAIHALPAASSLQYHRGPHSFAYLSRIVYSDGSLARRVQGDPPRPACPLYIHFWPGQKHRCRSTRHCCTGVLDTTKRPRLPRAVLEPAQRDYRAAHQDSSQRCRCQQLGQCIGYPVEWDYQWSRSCDRRLRRRRRWPTAAVPCLVGPVADEL